MNSTLFEYKGSVFVIQEFGWSRKNNDYSITAIRSAADDLWIPSIFAGFPIQPIITLTSTDRFSQLLHSFNNVIRLHIPAYVHKIRTYNCIFPNLSEIIIEPGNTDYTAIGSKLIRNCALEYVFNDGMKESCSVPKEVKTIEDYAFTSTKCTEIIFENPDVSVKDYSFDDSAWISQDIPLLIVGNTLYRCKTKDASVTIPDTIKGFANHVFRDTSSNLTKIITPRPLPQNCLNSLHSHLHQYILQKAPSKLNLNSIRETEALESFELLVPNKSYCTRDGVLFSGDMKKLLLYPTNKPDKSYQIPDGVESIQIYAFKNNRNLEEITMPDSVKKVGQAAFYGCKKLKYIHFSKNITDIPGTTDYMDDGVFEGCISLDKDIKFPPNLRHIGSFAFFGCQLTEINIPEGVEYIGEYAFASYAENNYSLITVLKRCSLPASLIMIGRGSIAGASLVTATEGTARGLICAIQAIPPTHKVDKCFNNAIWTASSINMIRSNGETEIIDLPENMNIASRLHIDLAWNQSEFDYDEYEECFEGITNTEEKQLFAMDIYQRKGNDSTSADYFKRIAPKLAESLIRNRSESRLIELIKFQVLSDKALQKLLKPASEGNMNTATAYIMQYLSNQKKSRSLKL